MNLAPRSRRLSLWLLGGALVVVGLAQPACSSATSTPEPAPDAAVTVDAKAPAPDAGTAPDSAVADSAVADSAVPPPGPTEFPAFEGALVTYANGGKFFGYKAVAKSVDLDASKIDAATNVYTAYFDDSTNRVVVTLPSRTAATLDLSATGPVKVDVVIGGADRVEGPLTTGKLELVEATDKKLKARFFGDVGGVKVHGAIDAVLVP